MINILSKVNPEKYSSLYETVYNYEGIPVPRVTHILQSMLHEDGLMDWSNYIGFKRQRYREVLQLAADKGTYVHNAIEDYIQNKNELDMESVKEDCRFDVYNAYNSFITWWNILTKKNVKVLMEEQPLVGKYFAGTLDILIEVNGRKYLLDFKTSNHVSYKHFIQLSAYRYLLKELYNIDIDGCGIIKLSKKEIDFEEVIIDLDEAYNAQFMNYCQETFFALVYGYFNRLQVEKMFKQVLKDSEAIEQ